MALVLIGYVWQVTSDGPSKYVAKLRDGSSGGYFPTAPEAMKVVEAQVGVLLKWTREDTEQDPVTGKLTRADSIESYRGEMVVKDAPTFTFTVRLATAAQFIGPFSGAQTIDGKLTNNGDIVLVKDDPGEFYYLNGPWVVSTSGVWSPLVQTLHPTDTYHVTDGNVNANTCWKTLITQDAHFLPGFGWNDHDVYPFVQSIACP